MDVKILSIDMINLSRRSQNALHRANIHTVGDMLALEEEQLYGIKNLGKKSIEEILEKINEYSRWEETDGIDNKELSSALVMPENMEQWLAEADGKQATIEYLEKNEIGIAVLDLMSARTYNLLMLNGYEFVYQILYMPSDELFQISRIDAESVNEIRKACQHYVLDNADAIFEYYMSNNLQDEPHIQYSIYDYMHMPVHQDTILKYVQSNDREIERMELSNRAKNQLLKNGYKLLSDIIFKSHSELQAMPAMGKTSVDDIMSVIREYLCDNEKRMVAVLSGDESALWDDDSIEEMILKLYNEKPFYGFSFADFKGTLSLPSQVADERLKRIIGHLIAAKKLEYVDFRCYRIYGKFSECVLHSKINERSRDILLKRLQGFTLEGIAKEYDLTRERVRQIEKKDSGKVRNEYIMSTGMHFFDEDYYRYFYETYDFDKKDAMKWLGITQDVFNYLEMMDAKKGKTELHSALEDYHNLNIGLRLKIKNYLNRNKLFVDGRWIDKKRADLEAVVVKKFCQNDVAFGNFVRIYNQFLVDEEIPYDENIYYTDAVLRTRKSHLGDTRYLLWKQNEQIRYYDVDGRDYSELLDMLNLSAFENVELSTLKFVEEYPELLARYDIRDQYELHNLLRKIVPEGSFHDFHCGRMPQIIFGEFDRESAILDLLIDNAPISLRDLCEIIHKEYGYDPAVIQGTYLQPFSDYYYKGMYQIDQKLMPESNRKILQNLLTEDFYYIDEIRKLYIEAVPNANAEDVNPYSLKNMGFVVLSKYAIQHHTSLEAYCEHILTSEDIIDISSYRKRMAYVQMFSQKLMELKRNLEIIEFEPNQIINFRKLKMSGVTKEMIQDFCNEVYDRVDDRKYFSLQQVKLNGFESDLFDLGFSDWFYSNLLLSDERFSFGMMFGNLIFYKGKEPITIKSFERELIKTAGVIDAYDLMSELTEMYGCEVHEKSDVIYKVQGTEIYYDKILDRFYADEDTYYREIEEMGGD